MQPSAVAAFFFLQFVFLGVHFDLSLRFVEDVLFDNNKPCRVPAITAFVRGAIKRERSYHWNSIRSGKEAAVC